MPSKAPRKSAAPRYYLGCPVWACAEWQGSLFKRSAPRTQWLSQYSTVFNTVEGNSTFYGLPDPKTVERWCEHSCDNFRFALKFPKEITHDHQLVGATQRLDEFLELLGILDEHDRLGPSLLQLPPFFDGSKLPVLEQFLNAWPADIPVAVEVRHADYFDEGPVEKRFEKMLRKLKVDQALFDSRPLFSAPPEDDIEVASQKRKPKSPYRSRAVGRYPMLRLVGRNTLKQVQPWIDQWADIVSGWIEEGRTPYVFTHAPNDLYAPKMAEMFHKALQERLPVLQRLNDWPGRGEATQLEFF